MINVILNILFSIPRASHQHLSSISVASRKHLTSIQKHFIFKVSTQTYSMIWVTLQHLFQHQMSISLASHQHLTSISLASHQHLCPNSIQNNLSFKLSSKTNLMIHLLASYLASQEHLISISEVSDYHSKLFYFQIKF